MRLHYWRAAIRQVPDLAFSIIDVTWGVDAIGIYYRAVLGKIAIETFFFNKEGLVYKAIATYNSKAYMRYREANTSSSR